MLEALKERVYEANMELVRLGLVVFTWGNVSAVDRDSGLIAIKPSGIGYDTLRPQDIVLVDRYGKVAEGALRPSSDTPTHLELYAHYGDIGGVVHTHSAYATAWAQSGRNIPFYGTTHADHFYGDIPCTRALTSEEVDGDYERNTGKVILECFADRDAGAVPGVIVKSHGPFAWGRDALDAVHNAKVLEEVAKMALWTEQINPKVKRADEHLLQKHYKRKHGKDAYYGQK